MEKYLVILEPGEQNWSAYSPDVLGCVATGQTVKETVQRMTEALSWHLQDLSRQGESLPVAQGISLEGLGNLVTSFRFPKPRRLRKPRSEFPVS